MYMGPQPLDKLQYSRVLEIAPDIWMIEGYLSDNFFTDLPSCNIFIMRDKETVLLIDTGLYPYFRKSILKILHKYKRDGAKELVLALTQGHFDHAGNNDVILEAGYEKVRFLLPEPERKTIHFAAYVFEDLIKQEKYYDPYATFPTNEIPAAFINIANMVSRKFTRAMIKFFVKKMNAGIKTLVERAEILTPNTYAAKKFGDLELFGWEIGRFFLIHDGGHTPGHISIYDPANKFLMMGDTSVEINPPFLDASMAKLIEYTKKYRYLAEQGFIDMVTDSHRSSLWFGNIMKKYKIDPLHRLELLDCIYGQDDVIAFIKIWQEYYEALRDETMAALKRLGEGTTSQIVAEFKKTQNRAAQFKLAMSWPRFPNRLETMVIIILLEANVSQRQVDQQILFSAPQ